MTVYFSKVGYPTLDDKSKEVIIETQTVISCMCPFSSLPLCCHYGNIFVCLSGRFPLEPTHFRMTLPCYTVGLGQDEQKLYRMGSNGPSVRLTLTVTSPCSNLASLLPDYMYTSAPSIKPLIFLSVHLSACGSLSLQ